jgi:hypothetical protein
MESFTELLGGRRGAIDSTVPSVAFVAGWLLAGHSIRAGSAAAIGAAIVVAAIRLTQRRPPRAAALGLLGVLIAVFIVLRTGRAEDFFLAQIATNAASALAWIVSILIRWPLLGVVVGVVLGQRTRWRRDLALLSAYSRGSWIWVGQYVLRVAVMLPLWAAGQTVALGITRIVLTGPLVAACLAVSYWVVRRSLPEDHPGLRRPR